MDATDLIERISKPISKRQAGELASKNAGSVHELIRISLHPNYEIAFRSAWILEQIVFSQSYDFQPLIPDFIKVYLKLTNESCQRHYTKIMMHLSLPANIGHQLADIDLEPIVETTFEWLIDPDSPVAVRVNCMDILYNLRKKYDWISDELTAQIHFQMKDGSAALQSRGRKVLYRLSRCKKV